MITKRSAPFELIAVVLAFWAIRVGSELVFFDAVPEAVYRHRFLVMGFAAHPALIGVATISLLPLAARSALRWDVLEGGVALRWAAAACVAVLAWAFSTYGFNYYYGHAHVAERLILVALAIAACRNAAWLPAFTVWFLVLLSQFAHPMGMKRFPTIELRLVQDVLFVLSAFVMLRSAGVLARWRPERPRPDARLALFFLIALTASYYLFPAIDKISISPSGTEWVLDNDLSFLLVEASRHGWLHWLGADRFELLRSAISAFSPFLLGFALLLELGTLFVFASRRIAIGLLLALATFHFATAMISGYLFWKWLVVELCIAAGLWRLGDDDVQVLFSRTSLAVSLVLIPLAFFYAEPNRLAWFERSYDYYFRFELLGEGGRVYSTDPSSFAPYTIAFAYDRFNHLLPRNALRGQKNYWNSYMLRHGGPKGVERVRARYGKPFWNKEATRALDHFLVTYFRERNRQAEPSSWLAWLRPPVFQIRWVNRDPEPYRGGVSIERVRVRYFEEYFAGPEVVELRNEILHEVAIARPNGSQDPQTDR